MTMVATMWMNPYLDGKNAVSEKIEMFFLFMLFRIDRNRYT
jgi:hypothetical protein